MTWLPIVFGVAAVGMWLYAVVHWTQALRNRNSEHTTLSHLMNGMKAFDPDNFNAEGQRHQQHFMMGFAGFFVCLVLTVVTMALTQPPV